MHLSAVNILLNEIDRRKRRADELFSWYVHILSQLQE